MKEKCTREFYAEFASRFIHTTKEAVIDFLKRSLDEPDLDKELEDEFGMQFFKNQMLLQALKKALSELDNCDEFDAEFIARMPTDFLIGFLLDFLIDVGCEISSFCEER